MFLIEPPRFHWPAVDNFWADYDKRQHVIVLRAYVGAGAEPVPMAEKRFCGASKTKRHMGFTLSVQTYIFTYLSLIRLCTLKPIARPVKALAQDVTHWDL